jgi:acetyl-CoA carboxylase biotin carboxylase subunit
MMFKRLLIANRGEIAVRVMRTARTLGISTVAVYSEADAHSAHVEMADEAVAIGSSEANSSYLNSSTIIDAARRTGAEAIHPGYGFLSENAEFAEACAAAGIVFVGPPPSAIRSMGLKDRAKELMSAAGVSVVPGYQGDKQSGDHLLKKSTEVGYPVLIKAVAGGGGKGMRKVDSAKDFGAALDSARREAKSAFGDDRVLIEKFVSRPRHIEVQVFADKHGNAVHLFERDCSLQRRHQKVIEEAPAPGMPEAMRTAMGAAAVKAAKAVGYVGAGTVEFIADASEGLKADRFWFMEMNTRLQVEHPVTEAIAGVDLVEWQLRVAAGEKLPKKQSDLTIQGHAIEVRLYAEDPANGFLPSIGTLEHLRFPAGVRVDSGVRQGDRVTIHYDPMIAKVIAHDKSRTLAAKKLANALSQVEIAGVRTNNAFLKRALESDDFLNEKIDTGFIERHLVQLTTSPAISDEAMAEAAHFVFVGEGKSAAGKDPWSCGDSFRLAGRSRQVVEFEIGGRRVAREPRDVPNRQFTFARLTSGAIAAMRGGETFVLDEYDPLASAEAHGASTDAILAPMPGKVSKLFVKAGEKVVRGQALAILEAMKMEHTLAAPADAEIESVDIEQGHQVGEGQVLLRFKKEGS